MRINKKLPLVLTLLTKCDIIKKKWVTYMFSDKLKKLRMESGMTQVQFASEFGISSGTIAMWETGKRMPDLNMVAKIADYFGVTVDYLADRESELGNGDHRVQILARKTKDLPESEREDLLNLLDATVNTFLKAKGKLDD